jgi:Uma2 family endonuclease
MSVEVDADTIYEPDVVVRCGPRLPPDTIKLADPLIVVEVLSPSTRNNDLTDKLVDYFRLPSVRHYLVVNPQTRIVVHHERTESGTIVIRLPTDRPIRFDPPGIEIADFFPAD